MINASIWRWAVVMPITLICVGICYGQEPPSADLRQRTIIDRDWRFTLGDPPAASAGDFDDGAWQAVNLPHSFSEPYFLSPEFYQGVGWYPKHFSVPADAAGRRISIEFDGAYRASQIFVNGKPVGSHPGGYTGFLIDLTDAVHPGADNLLAVRLDNRWNAQLAPRAGDHLFSGGIYRDVWLVMTDPVHVTWYGTFVKTPGVTAATGIVNIDTEVANDSGQTKQISVESAVTDSHGRSVATVRSTPQTVLAKESKVISQQTSAIASPKLWSPSSPAMYTVRTTVYDGDRAADTYVTPFGFRSITFTPEQGFFLNGGHYSFKGANVHQDHAGWGDAVTRTGAARDVRMIKDAGFDFIRGSHYPHSPAFADACDTTGVLFWSENDFWGAGGFKTDGGYLHSPAYPSNAEDDDAFDQSVLENLRDMIRVHRNHPSIIAWSTGNEDFFSQKQTLPQVRVLLSKEVAFAHELDPTRPVGIGGCQRGNIDKLGDIAGYNGDGARLFIDPGIPSIVTEYGSTTAVRPGNYDPGWGDLNTANGQDKSQPYPWRYPWRSGEAIWCGFDHGTQYGAGLGKMGLIDYFRIPKRAYYWYRNEYRHIPPPTWPKDGVPAKLLLAADKTTISHADGTDDVHLLVTVLDAAGNPISNSPPVDLTVVSGAAEFPTGPSITFDQHTDIPILDGVAAIELRSYWAGTTVIRATSPGLQDDQITITCAGGPSFIPDQTPMAQARPYVRFSAVETGSRSVAAASTFGHDNPTFASSEAPGHPGNLANDGDEATFWQAASGDTRPSWTVDLEKSVILEEVSITFPDSGVHWFSIEMSADQKIWKTVADQIHDDPSAPAQDVNLASGSRGRFVRITLSAGVPCISEFSARGELLAP